jgi:hypothetical protein
LNGLKEIRLLGRQYTWANNLPDPIFEKLDRGLVTAEWDQAFPLAVVTSMNRDISNHVPLLLKYGVTPPHSNSFRYENCGVEREGFVDIVKESWTASTYHKFDIDKWQEKMRRLRRHIKGWHINVEGAYRKEKKMLLDKMDILDKKEEHTPLSVQEKEMQVDMHKRI